MLSKGQIKRLYRLYGQGANRRDFNTLVDAYFKMVQGERLSNIIKDNELRRKIIKLGIRLGFFTRLEGKIIPLGTKYHMSITSKNNEIKYSIWAPLWFSDEQIRKKVGKIGRRLVGNKFAKLFKGVEPQISKSTNPLENRSSYTLLVGNLQYEANFIYQWDERGICFLRRMKKGAECHIGIPIRSFTFISKCNWNFKRFYPREVPICTTIHRKLEIPPIPRNLIDNAAIKIRRYMPSVTAEGIKLGIFAYRSMVEDNDNINSISELLGIEPDVVRRLLSRLRLISPEGEPLGDYVCYAINSQPYEPRKGKRVTLEARFCLWQPIYASEPGEYMFSNVLQVAATFMNIIPAGPSESMIIGITKAWKLEDVFYSVLHQVTPANLQDWIEGRFDFHTVLRNSKAIFQRFEMSPPEELRFHNRDKFRVSIVRGNGKIDAYEGIFRYRWSGDIICYLKIEGLQHPEEPEFLSCTTQSIWISMTNGFELCPWNFGNKLRYSEQSLNSDSLCR